jgi:glucosamine kinase
MEKTQITKQLAANIEQLMRARKLSNRDFAKKCGISPGTVSKIINGNMSITITVLAAICKGLDVPADAILKGIVEKSASKTFAIESSKKDELFAGIFSINHKRISCIKDTNDAIIGRSELRGDLDIAEPVPSVFNRIVESIKAAFKGYKSEDDLKSINLTVVIQSYEFEATKKKFKNHLRKYFKSVNILSDWQITYLLAFQRSDGISLVVDKGVSISYMQEGEIKKLGGWKFPVYDLGGENWLGLMTIRHAIEAYEGHVPMSNLAKDILSKFDWQIGGILEFCFKTEKNPDVFCSFFNPLFQNYLTGDDAAKKIVEQGFSFINKLLNKVDELLGDERKIALNGSLLKLYKDYLPQSRLITSADLEENRDLLLDVARKYRNKN